MHRQQSLGAGATCVATKTDAILPRITFLILDPHRKPARTCIHSQSSRAWDPWDIGRCLACMCDVTQHCAVSVSTTGQSRHREDHARRSNATRVLCSQVCVRFRFGILAGQDHDNAVAHPGLVHLSPRPMASMQPRSSQLCLSCRAGCGTASTAAYSKFRKGSVAGIPYQSSSSAFLHHDRSADRWYAHLRHFARTSGLRASRSVLVSMASQHVDGCERGNAPASEALICYRST